MQQQPYRQRTAMLAITRASLRALFRSPSAVIFSFGFPLIFILVFGFIGGGGTTVRIGLAPGTDTSASNWVYAQLKQYKSIRIMELPAQQMQQDLEKGRLTAIVGIQPTGAHSFPLYRIIVQTSTASADKIGLLQTILNDLVRMLDVRAQPGLPSYASIEMPPPLPGRMYRTIDFILPGQLGFSLLSAGVFGVAFLFFNLRQTLVLKRFFATPISRTYILLGEGLSRVIFQLITAVVILLVGHFAFGFTLVHGVLTFFELLLLSFVGLIVFMGFGFVVSGLAKNESVIPPFANLVTLPQFLLAGTFFSIDNFPRWLQPVCNVLPLTHLNNAMRNIAFEGSHLIDCGKELGILAVWALVIYTLAVRVFRWE